MWMRFWPAFLSAGIAKGVFLRNPQTSPDGGVKHLVQDVEESISKAGEDAEMVFASLFTYGGQLDTSLKREIGTLDQTLTSLVAMKKAYDSDLTTSHAKSSSLGSSAQDSEQMASKYEAGTLQTRNNLESLQQNVRMLIALLKSAHVGTRGVLLTPEAPDARGEPARVYASIRRLLRASPAIKEAHSDVFSAFLPEGVSQFPVVHMTEDLLQSAIGALLGVEAHLQSMESQALLQFGSMHRRFEENAVSAGAKAQAQKGLEAENEQKAAELTFSIKFTKEVLQMDQHFRETAESHLKANSDIVYGIRDLREAQLKILRDLTGIFDEKQPVTIGGLSFLEADVVTSSSQASSLRGLRSEAENAIHNNGDTHAILMRLKEELDKAEPITAPTIPSMPETMAEIQGVIGSVEVDKSKFEEATRVCDSQKFHAKEQEEALNANLALMSAAHDHAQKAIEAAKTNIQGIEKKARALQKSSQDFSQISAQATKALEAQSKDRSTIQLAVHKAMEVVAPVGRTLMDIYGESDVGRISVHKRMGTVQLMKTLSEDITAQELKESTFRKMQIQFQSEFVKYVKDYTQLLEDRRAHYEASLGILTLHVSELASDLQVQQQTVGTGRELREQSAALCESVLKFHEKHSKMRADLSSTLKSVAAELSESASSDSRRN